MPTMPPIMRPPGARDKRERDRDFDSVRRSVKPWRAWYGRAAWRARRADQLAAKPYCERCERYGAQRLATVVNHVIAHKGDWSLFIGGALESLCKPCHDGEVQREERAAARQPDVEGRGVEKSGPKTP